MSEFDDLVADVSKGAGDSGVDERENEVAPRRTAAPSETSVIKSTEDVVRVLAERGAKEIHPPSSPSRGQVAGSGDLPASRPRSARARKVVEKGDGSCGAYAPKGTKCKLCGKVHP